jgi:hypothetical protein
MFMMVYFLLEQWKVVLINLLGIFYMHRLYQLYDEMSLIYLSLERLNHYYIGMIPNNQYSSLHFQNGISQFFLIFSLDTNLTPT